MTSFRSTIISFSPDLRTSFWTWYGIANGSLSIDENHAQALELFLYPIPNRSELFEILSPGDVECINYTRGTAMDKRPQVEFVLILRGVSVARATLEKLEIIPDTWDML